MPIQIIIGISDLLKPSIQAKQVSSQNLFSVSQQSLENVPEKDIRWH